MIDAIHNVVDATRLNIRQSSPKDSEQMTGPEQVGRQGGVIGRDWPGSG